MSQDLFGNGTGRSFLIELNGVGVMAKYICTCGARYRFPDSAIGKHGKCQKCGAVFTLKEHTEDTIPIADEPDLLVDSHLENPTIPQKVSPKQGKVFTSPASPVHNESDSPALDVPRTAGKSFTSDVIWTFLFPSSPGNLVVFLVIWAAMVLGSLIPVVGFFISIVLTGWFAAFRFAVLKSAAAGEDHLPDLNMSSDILEDFLVPFFQWIGSWVLIMLPAFAYLIFAIQRGWVPSNTFFEVLFGGVGGVLQSSKGVDVIYVLLFAGIFCWPMVALCIAMGGFSTLYRIDLIMITISKTFMAYTLIVTLMIAAVLAQKLFTGIMVLYVSSSDGSSISGFAGKHIFLKMLFTGTTVYLEIVIMRLIGLYYHHNKHKFAWSWE